MLSVRLKVTSRKLTDFLFTSMVMRSPYFSKIAVISLLLFSVSFSVLSVTASPSSRYNPTPIFCLYSACNIQ